jgi:RNA polymerase sigma factor (sigma-70 family)
MSLTTKKDDRLDATAAVAMHERFLRVQTQRWINRLPHLKMYEDDLMQEGRMGLMWAAAHFDVSRGVTFLSFAGKAIYNLMRNFVARKSHLVRFPAGAGVKYLWLDEPCKAGERPLAETLPLMEDDAWEADDRSMKLQLALRDLKPAEQQVIVQCVMGGRLQREVAVEMGCSHTWVQQLVESAMRKLRLAMGLTVRPAKVKRVMMQVPAGHAPMKEWMANEAAKLGTTPQALQRRIERGTHPAPVILTRNGRHFIQTEQPQNNTTTR